MNIEAFFTAQDTVAQNIARSIDFSGLQAASEALAANTNVTAIVEAQQRWVQTVSASIDFSALQRANEALVSGALTAINDAQRSWAEAFALQIDFTPLIYKLNMALPKMDFGRWLEILDRWIPGNLREIGNLGAVAQLALDEGLPLSWVPRHGV